MKFKLHMYTILAVSLLSFACNKGDDDEEETLGNAILLTDRSPNVAIEGQDITINRVRIWQSAPNQNKPGVLTIVDSYLVELWATLAGEATSRYVEIPFLKADADGNLFNPESTTQPGSIIYQDTPTGVETYTMTAVDGLMTSEFPRYHIRRNESVITLAGQITTVNNLAVDIATLAEGPWKNLKNRAAPQLFTRGRQEQNVNYATKGKMACFLRPGDGTGNVSQGQYIFADVELGSSVRSGVQSQVNTAGGDATGDDDSLWINYTDTWFVTGINVKNMTIRTYKELAAPYYTGRELPGVDSDQTTPSFSGVELLLRSCNTATKGLPGTFGLLNVSTFDASPTANGSYCSVFDVASAAEATKNNLSLVSPFYNDGTTSCTLGTIGLTAGTWNGAAHPAGSSISSPTGVNLYRTATAITETVF